MALLCALACGSPAFAATQVAGPIEQSTAWTVAGSPYVLTGDVAIRNGANLSVEPGVQIHMNTGANLSVEVGALSAQGTVEAPIVMTSAKPSPQAGDWGVLAFEDGTNDASTVLSHVQVRYGNGIVIEHASPRIDDTAIEHNAGAAITIDLASSPVGRGLSATGNTIDGVVVPAGVVVVDIAWRLRGIPYVVGSGLVEIGRAPFNLSPSVLQLVAGHTGELTINLPEPAPAGGASVTLQAGANGVASVVSPVVVPAGALQATVSVTAVRVGETGITATVAGGASAQASVVVGAQPTLTLSASSPGVIAVGRAMNWTVSRNVTNGAVVVDLAASLPGVFSVPATATIADGQTSVSFDVHGIAVGTATLTANTVGYTGSSASVSVRMPKIDAPQTALVAVGATESLTVKLSDPAPAAGLVVSATSDAPAKLDVPAQITVPAGATSFVVPLHSPGTVAATATVTFTADGYAPASTNVSIYKIVPYLLRDGDVSLPQGIRLPTRVGLSAAAPAGGLKIALSSLVPGIVDFEPAEVTIPAGGFEAPVTLVGVREGHTVVRLAGVNLTGVTRLQNADVTSLLKIQLYTYDEPFPVGKALTGRVDIRVVGSGGQSVQLPYDFSITLTSDDPAKVRVPVGAITMAANHSYATAQIDGVDVTSGPVRIRAQVSPDAGVDNGNGLAVSVVTPRLHFGRIGERAISTGSRDHLELDWDMPGVDTSPERPLRLQIVDADPAGIVDGFYASDTAATPATDFAQYSVWFGAPTAPGRFKVRATLAGVGEWTSPEQIVGTPSFRFDEAAMTLGLGLTTAASDMRVRTAVGNDDTMSDLPADFALTSSDPSKVQISEIQNQGNGEKSFRLRGLGLTASGQPVAIRATGSGRAPAQLDVTVGPAQIDFVDLDDARSPASGPDSFGVRWAGKHSPSADQAAVVTVAIAAGATPGVLPDPGVTSPSGGAATVTIPARATRGDSSLTVAAALAHGTYRLAATIAGAPAGYSATQAVDFGVVELGRASEFVPEYFPTGRLMKSGARVTLRSGAGGGEVPAPAATTVHLVSRAPGWVSVPASVVIPQGESFVEFDVVGVELTGDEEVAIDAYLGGATVPSSSMPVRVFPTDLRLQTASTRPLDDGPSALEADADFYYPGCGVLAATAQPASKQAASRQAAPLKTAQVPSDYCKGYGRFAQAQTVPVEIVSDGSPPVAPGFVTEAGAPASALTFAADENSADPLFVATPSRAGTYRVRATFGEQTYESNSVLAGSPRIVSQTGVVRVGAGTVDDDGVRLELRIGDEYADPPSTPITVSMACADTSICSVPATVVLDGNSIEIPLTGLATGRTTVTFSAPGLPPIASVTVDVVKPQLVVTAEPAQLAVGNTASISVRLWVPGGGTLSATQPIVIALASADAAVASVVSDTITIAVGEWEGSANGAVRALRAGTTAIVASSAATTTGVSGVVTVTGTGN